ncbi:MAG: sugar phosphate isomerase/epimerase [Planctomycetes bacterium]|nr:sugar phosphate isomerase/epimerase [Planctomycetota bacterium]
MPQRPQVVLSGFGDEAANHKTAAEQFAAFAAMGLQYYSLRFVDVGGGVKNVMKLTKTEITKLRHVEDEYGMNVASIGSPIGKIKLRDVEDGTKNPYVPFDQYLDKEVSRACELAHAFETKLIRGFSFYHPKGSDPREHLAQTADHLGQIAEACHRSDLTFGLEIEANLVGQTGELMAELHRRVNHPALVTVFDAGNIISQGYTPEETFAQYLAMKPSIGWIHIKDYHDAQLVRTAHVDEDKLKHFVPANLGDSGHERILRDFAEVIPQLEEKLTKRGIPGVILDLEPHLKGGGQFGGFSGPDGMGVALRGLCRVLDHVRIEYHLRDFDDVRAERGF